MANKLKLEGLSFLRSEFFIKVCTASKAMQTLNSLALIFLRGCLQPWQVQTWISDPFRQKLL